MELKEKGIDYMEVIMDVLKNYTIDLEQINNKINDYEIDQIQQYFYNFSGQIVGFDESGKTKGKIGEFWGVCINIGEFDACEDDTFFCVCDQIDETMCNFALAISNDGEISNEILEQCEKIVYLDRIFIESKYRQYGIGSYIMENFSKIFSQNLNINFDAIILEVTPQERNDENQISEYTGEDTADRKKKLIKLYKKLGFRYFNKTKYMIRFE